MAGGKLGSFPIIGDGKAGRMPAVRGRWSKLGSFRMVAVGIWRLAVGLGELGSFCIIGAGKAGETPAVRGGGGKLGSFRMVAVGIWRLAVGLGEVGLFRAFGLWAGLGLGLFRIIGSRARLG